MHPIHPAVEKLRRSGRIAARGLAIVACTLMLAGCYTAQERVTPADFDYRLRHNIAIKEGPRTVELFIGSNRGGLNGEQRADVLAFANFMRATKAPPRGPITSDVLAGEQLFRTVGCSGCHVASIRTARAAPRRACPRPPLHAHRHASQTS